MSNEIPALEAAFAAVVQLGPARRSAYLAALRRQAPTMAVSLEQLLVQDALDDRVLTEPVDAALVCWTRARKQET